MFNSQEDYIKKFVASQLKLEEEDPKVKALTILVEKILEGIMIGERAVYLEGVKGDKGNGYYERKVATPMGKLELKVPRTREGDFRPSILPPLYERTDFGYENLLQALVESGYTESAFENFFERFGLPYSRKEKEKIKEKLKEKIEDFKTRQLPENMFALFIDGYHTEVKIDGKVRKVCLYVIAGIDLEGNKTLIGFYLYEGTETKDKWRDIFEDIITRGLKKVLVIVSDDLPGISEVIKTLFPLSDHQLCYVHLERNVRKNMKKEDAKDFNKELKKIKDTSFDFDDSMKQFDKILSFYEKKYPTFIKKIKEKKEKYFAFTKYPYDIRKFIYTTNIVENINKQVENTRIKIGGYFQSQDVLFFNLFIQLERLKYSKWKKPVPILKSKSYEINQIFNLKFFGDKLCQTQNS